MNAFCLDKDLLAMEPVIFLSAGCPGQDIARGTGGSLSGTTFTDEAAAFAASGIMPGMVLCAYPTIPAEGSASEIVSVESETSLVVSVLRADESLPPAAPPPGENMGYHVRTFAAQIAAVSGGIGERLRRLGEAAGVRTDQFAPSSQLRTAAACGALAAIYLARAENSRAGDANWIKADYYRAEFRRLQLQLRLAVDADGDGLTERTRTLGNVTLRRL